MPKAISFHQVSFTFQQALLDKPKFTSSIINTVHVRNETIGLDLTQAHNLFVLWAWVSYFGLFSA